MGRAYPGLRKTDLTPGTKPPGERDCAPNPCFLSPYLARSPHAAHRSQDAAFRATPALKHLFFFYFYFLKGCVAGKALSTRALKCSWSRNCMFFIRIYIYIQARALSRARCLSPPAACRRAAAVVCSGSRVGGRRKQTRIGVTVSSSRSPQDLWLSLPAGMRLRPGCAAGAGCDGGGTWVPAPGALSLVLALGCGGDQRGGPREQGELQDGKTLEKPLGRGEEKGLLSQQGGMLLDAARQHLPPCPWHQRRSRMLPSSWAWRAAHTPPGTLPVGFP